LGLGLAAVVLAGCRVDARVEITMHGDGTGVVHTTLVLDGAAVRQIGGVEAAARQVPLADLRTAGWQVSPWARSAVDGATITFTHSYTGEVDLARRVADLVGPQGVLRAPSLTRDRGWFSSRDALSLVIDLRAPTTGIGSDADLRARLRRAGVDPSALDAQLTQQLRDALHVSVVVHLPGGDTRTLDGTAGSSATLHASRTRTDYDQMVKVGIAGTLALLAGLFMAAAGAGARRERRRRAQRIRSNRVEQERAPLM